MRATIIGGTSFIGPHVVRSLAARGIAVTVYHRGVHNVALPDTVREVTDPRAQCLELCARKRRAKRSRLHFVSSQAHFSRRVS
jgi:nucleoside-diphosphate-sugar epimerase